MLNICITDTENRTRHATGAQSNQRVVAAVTAAQFHDSHIITTLHSGLRWQHVGSGARIKAQTYRRAQSLVIQPHYKRARYSGNSTQENPQRFRFHTCIFLQEGDVILDTGRRGKQTQVQRNGFGNGAGYTIRDKENLHLNEKDSDNRFVDLPQCRFP